MYQLTNLIRCKGVNEEDTITIENGILQLKCVNNIIRAIVKKAGEGDLDEITIKIINWNSKGLEGATIETKEDGKFETINIHEVGRVAHHEDGTLELVIPTKFINKSDSGSTIQLVDYYR